MYILMQIHLKFYSSKNLNAGLVLETENLYTVILDINLHKRSK